jgi:hypothetical protein
MAPVARRWRRVGVTTAAGPWLSSIALAVLLAAWGLKDGTPVLELGDTRVGLDLGNGLVFNTRQGFASQLKAADRDGSGYLDEQEAQQSPFFRGLFKAVGRDGDGKLFLKEVLAYFQEMEELRKDAAACVVSLQVSDQGKGLFELLDADGNGLIDAAEAEAYDKRMRAKRQLRKG